LLSPSPAGRPKGNRWRNRCRCERSLTSCGRPVRSRNILKG
jgi:hypothetical protein